MFLTGIFRLIALTMTTFATMTSAVEWCPHIAHHFENHYAILNHSYIEWGKAYESLGKTLSKQWMCDLADADLLVYFHHDYVASFYSEGTVIKNSHFLKICNDNLGHSLGASSAQLEWLEECLQLEKEENSNIIPLFGQLLNFEVVFDGSTQSYRTFSGEKVYDSETLSTQLTGRKDNKHSLVLKRFEHLFGPFSLVALNTSNPEETVFERPVLRNSALPCYFQPNTIMARRNTLFKLMQSFFENANVFEKLNQALTYIDRKLDSLDTNLTSSTAMQQAYEEGCTKINISPFPATLLEIDFVEFTSWEYLGLVTSRDSLKYIDLFKKFTQQAHNITGQILDIALKMKRTQNLFLQLQDTLKYPHISDANDKQHYWVMVAMAASCLLLLLCTIALALKLCLPAALSRFTSTVTPTTSRQGQQVQHGQQHNLPPATAGPSAPPAPLDECDGAVIRYCHRPRTQLDPTLQMLLPNLRLTKRVTQLSDFEDPD